MHRQSGKFLVDLLAGLGHRQLFFLIWFLIVSAFILLIVVYYRKTLRRNFRESSARLNVPPPRSDSKGLATESMDLAVKKTLGVKSSHPTGRR